MKLYRDDMMHQIMEDLFRFALITPYESIKIMGTQS